MVSMSKKTHAVLKKVAVDTFLVQPVKKSSPERLASQQGPRLDSSSRREL